MASNKERGKKKRLMAAGDKSDAPLWASMKKFGMKRTRTRRIRVDKEKHWRRDSKDE